MQTQTAQVKSNPIMETAPVFSKWSEFPISEISHHGESCCDGAKGWLSALDYSYLNAADSLTGPRWLRQKYQWGASAWSIFWCDAVKRKTLDCGVLSAFSAEIFNARGVKNYRVQLVQQFSDSATAHWNSSWAEKEVPTYWINRDTIYHEVNAVQTDGENIKIWDASAGCWVNSAQNGGYGSVSAIKVFAPHDNSPETAFKWGQHSIKPNQWTVI
jgi:hypothetical protein